MKEARYIKGLDNKYLVAIVISLIIGGSIIGYGYLDYKYKKEALEQKSEIEARTQLNQLVEKQNQQELNAQKEKQLQDCLDEVNNRLTGAFRDANNVSYRDLELGLDIIEKQKSECFKKYPLD